MCAVIALVAARVALPQGGEDPLMLLHRLRGDTRLEVQAVQMHVRPQSRDRVVQEGVTPSLRDAVVKRRVVVSQRTQPPRCDRTDEVFVPT